MVGSPGEAVTASPLLETKFYVPNWRPGLVPRPGLVRRLDQGIERKLTLLSAPAGFGKTTLLAEWLAVTPAGERPAGWVSLDQSDNDPAFFWAYFFTALQKIRPGVGESALSLMQSPQPPPIESVLTTLINELNAIPDDFILILDDYHLIDAQPVHDAVGFLLDHLPPRMHLVIATRSDPPLALARLRGRSEATELRASDLRFTTDEAAVFLNDMMGLGLSAGDVAALETRTEGWIAGLQLAALSMRGREDIPGFIRAFAGDNRYIVDYLVASTGRVITSAALIMIAVFLGFVLGDDPFIKMMGLGLATAIFVDATIVRLVLVPAMMTLMGDANWWIPAWLDRLLPTIDIDGDAGLPPPEMEAELGPTGTGM